MLSYRVCTDVDEFLDSVYQAGMDINLDMEDMRERIESINQANKYLKLIDEAVELMRKYHPQGEKYYWVLYYTYMSAYRAENTDEILDKLEPHFPRIPRMQEPLILDGEIRLLRQSAIYYGIRNKKSANIETGKPELSGIGK